jgi:RNA polymerase sigma factor (sigma-70 family)
MVVAELRASWETKRLARSSVSLEAAQANSPLSPPRWLLERLRDDQLVRIARRGEEAAFETIYDRYHRQLLAFCRHMLGSREDSEDALQHTFGAAFRELREPDREIHLRRWLYTTARNRCINTLRARRERPAEELDQVSTHGLSEEVERRAEIRHLVSDLKDLPENQRAALLLLEAGDLRHPEIAEVLDCDRQQVKAYVFQARSSLIASREAREVPCAEIREYVATATNGKLRRGWLRRHLRHCGGCREFANEVRRQRQALALVLPVAPSLGLKLSVLGKAGIGAGSSFGGAGGGGGLIASMGASGAAKALAIGLAATGVTVAVAVLEPSPADSARTSPAPTPELVPADESPARSGYRGASAQAGRAFGPRSSRASEEGVRTEHGSRASKSREKRRPHRASRERSPGERASTSPRSGRASEAASGQARDRRRDLTRRRLREVANEALQARVALRRARTRRTRELRSYARSLRDGEERRLVRAEGDVRRAIDTLGGAARGALTR